MKFWERGTFDSTNVRGQFLNNNNGIWRKGKQIKLLGMPSTGNTSYDNSSPGDNWVQGEVLVLEIRGTTTIAV